MSCGEQSKCGPTSARVERVIDGDTIELSDGQKVRYLLVDAPETTGGKNDCYGAQAVEFNQSMVEGKDITLKYDEAGCHDKFNRLLAYVSVQGTEVNRALIDQGLACVLYISPAGKARQEEFEALESNAQTNRVGLWGTCNPVTCG